MKRTFFLFLALLLSYTFVYAQEDEGNANFPERGIVVFTSDSDGAYTNIRRSANGKVACTLSTDTTYTFVVTPETKVVNGWFCIPDDAVYWYDETDVDKAPERDYTAAGHIIALEGSTTGYWIHGSLLRVWISSDISLFKKPDGNAEEVYHTNTVLIETVSVLNQREGWLEVKTLDGKHTGWVAEGDIIPHPLIFNNDCSCGESEE